MTNKVKFPWEVGKTYFTKGGLYATITRVKQRAVPREMSLEELEELLSLPHFGIEGVVWLPSDSKQRSRSEWTMGGIHCLHHTSTGIGDLTTNRVVLPGEEEDETH